MSWAIAGEASKVAASPGSDGRKMWKANGLVTLRKTSSVVSPVPCADLSMGFTASVLAFRSDNSRYGAGRTSWFRETMFAASRFRGNDGVSVRGVIPAKAGIHGLSNGVQETASCSSCAPAGRPAMPLCRATSAFRLRVLSSSLLQLNRDGSRVSIRVRRQEGAQR